MSIPRDGNVHMIQFVHEYNMWSYKMKNSTHRKNAI